MPPLAEEEPNGPVMPSPREPSSSTIFDPPKIGTASREHADRVRYPEGSRHTDIGHFHTNVTWNDPLAPSSVRSTHLELRGLTGTATHLGPTAPVRHNLGLVGTTGTVMYPRVPPTLGTLPKRLKSS